MKNGLEINYLVGWNIYKLEVRKTNGKRIEEDNTWVEYYDG